MRSVFDRPGRRDRRLEEFVALSASHSSFAKGYTPAEHASALDCLLADLGVEDITPADESAGHEPTPDIVVKPIHETDEDDSRLFLTLAC